MVDYSPTENCYARIDFDIDSLVGTNRSIATTMLLDEFSSIQKNIVVRDIAMTYWKGYCKRMKIYCNNDDIQQAYDLAYGYGCEFGWEVLG